MGYRLQLRSLKSIAGPYAAALAFRFMWKPSKRMQGRGKALKMPPESQDIRHLMLWRI
ncbi:hypothetical protein MCEMIEM13_01285 [Comamonadaceae bacterium]